MRKEKETITNRGLNVEFVLLLASSIIST